MMQFGKGFACVAIFSGIVCVLLGELLPAFALVVSGLSVWVSAMISEGP